MNHSKLSVIVGLLLVSIFLLGCTETQTFKDSGAQICAVDGKPIIRMYSTTWCPHCNWIGETYNKVVNDYVDKNLIIAYHWQVDVLDNTLTDVNEGAIPENEYAEFLRVSPKGSIPAYSFGCTYTRLGNGYEAQKDLVAEEKEFRAVIDKLITQAKK
jgi:thiol-disulfide isomerase/thioredoxin